MSIESDKERQERIEKAGFGSPEYFGEVFKLGTSNQIRDEWRITDPVRVRRLVADKLGIDPEEVEALELGKLGIPPREQLVEWNKKLNLAKDTSDYIILSAGYSPDLPVFSPAQRQRMLELAIMEVVEAGRRSFGFREIVAIHLFIIRDQIDSFFRSFRKRK